MTSWADFPGGESKSKETNFAYSGTLRMFLRRRGWSGPRRSSNPFTGN